MVEIEKADNQRKEDLVAKSRSAIGWPDLCRALSARANSEPGKRECGRPALYGKAAAVETALSETGEMASLFERGDPPPPLAFEEIGPLVRSAQAQGVLDPLDFIKILRVLESASLARSYFRSQPDTGRLTAWSSRLDELKDFRKRIERSVDPDGVVLDTASAALHSLRSRHRTLKERIHRRLTEIVSHDPDSILQDSFYTQRAQRYVIPVRSTARGKIKGIVHDASSSGQTVFVEPVELVEPNNQIKLIEAEIESEIARIMRELSETTSELSGPLLDDQSVLAHLDEVRARARLAIDLKSSRPAVNDDGRVRLEAARHPLLMLRGHPVVPNNLTLGPEAAVLLVSGPNTGGKTVGMTTLGLFALMTKAGMFIPAAPGSEMAVFDEVYAVIGDEQDLSLDLSSFAAHLHDIIGALEHARDKSLVLLDELMNSTDPEEGTALGAAVLAALRDQGARVMATTHLPALKTFAHREPGFVNAGYAFDPRTLEPTYKLMQGVPGRSLGIEIAKRLGLSERLIARARSEMPAAAARMEELMGELSARMIEVERERGELEQMKMRLGAREREYDTLMAEAKKREKAAREAQRQGVRQALRRAEADLERILEPVKKKGERFSREEIMAARRQLRGYQESNELAGSDGEGQPPDWRTLAKGDRVMVLPLMVEAELGETPGEDVAPDRKIRVRIGKLKVAVEAERLRALPKPPARVQLEKPKPRRHKEKVKEPPMTLPEEPRAESGVMVQTSQNTLDLRGLRAYEAESRIDDFLDQACRRRLNNVYIIHGHGTGALKQMVRDQLAGSPYVDSFRPGKQGEGGDGVTMAVLKELGLPT